MSVIPTIGLGTWKLNGEECERVVQQALEIGYRHIDTADDYRNHKEIGQVLQSWPRDEIFLTTKLSFDRLDQALVEKDVPRFLEELKTDYLDLLLIHWPNPKVNMVETLKAMLPFKEKGIARNIGVSNFVRSHLDTIAPYHFPVITNQIELHPYLQRRELVDKCKKMGVHITAYRPLAKGAFESDPIFQKIGKKYNKSPSQVALRWLTQKGHAVIPKASSYEHLKANYDISIFKLDDSDIKAIENLDRNERFCAPDSRPNYMD